MSRACFPRSSRIAILVLGRTLEGIGEDGEYPRIDSGKTAFESLDCQKEPECWNICMFPLHGS